MNKVIVLLACLMTAETMPMNWLMSKASPISQKLALLNKITFVKPHTIQARPYFSKSINFMKDFEQKLEEDRKAHLARLIACTEDKKLKHENQIQIMSEAIANINAVERAQKNAAKERSELEHLNISFNQKANELKKTVSTTDSLSNNIHAVFELINKKNDLYKQIREKKKEIDQKFAPMSLNYNGGRQFKLPEE